MHKPIRVLQVIGRMDRGGAETLLMNLYRVIDREQIQFDFVESTQKETDYDSEILELGGRIYRCPRYSGVNYLAYTSWWKAFFKEHAGEYSIIHGHIGSTAAIYLRLAKREGLFTIAHSHNTNSARSFRQLLYNLCSFKTRFVADYFFACTDEAGIDRYGKRIVSSDRYQVFRNGIDTRRFVFRPETRRRLREEFGIDEKDRLIGHIGRFYDQKNHEFLIKLFQRIHQDNPGIKLLLVGDGPLKDKIRELVRERGIENAVIFTGVRSDIEDILQTLDLLVFPSKYEGFPVVLVEAQCSGLDCVISDAIASEVMLVPDLITRLPLSEDQSVWEKHIIEKLDASKERSSRQKEIQDKGYDIRENAKILQYFYLSYYHE